MARVALGAAPDRAVLIRPADLVAADAPGGGGRCAFQQGECIRRTIHRAGVMSLAERDLVGRHVGRASDRGPRRQRVPAAGELIVLGAVAALAVQRRHVLRQTEVVMVVCLLPVVRLMTVEAGDVGAAVLAAFELMDDGRGLFAMALGAAPRRTHEFR